MNVTVRMRSVHDGKEGIYVQTNSAGPGRRHCLCGDAGWSGLAARGGAGICSTDAGTAGAGICSAGVSSSLTYMYNYYNQLCLDGREGPAGVTLQTCGADGTHEVWRKNFYIGYWTLQNVYNGLCLDGREGRGNITLQRCGADGAHEWWLATNIGGSIATTTFTDLYNQECLDGREAPIGVTVAACNSDGTHEVWAADGAGT